MTLSNLQFRWILPFLFVAIGMVGVEWMVVHSVVFLRKPDLISLGVTLDFTLGLPVLYYMLVVRKAKVSPLTIIGLILLSGLLASLVLPASYHYYLGYWEKVVALIEVGMLVVVVRKGRTVLHQFRHLQALRPDFVANLQTSLTVAVGSSRLASLLVGEVSVFRYTLFAWMSGVEKTDQQRAFTMHRESGQVALVTALLLVGLIETLVVHLFLTRWHPLVAVIITLIGLYGLLFFVADTVALIKRPILLDGDIVRVRLGLRWQLACAVADVEQVSPISEKPAKAPDTLNGSFIVAPNVLLTLRKPVIIEGPYGIRRTVRRIAFFVDERDAFMQAVSQLSSNQ